MTEPEAQLRERVRREVEPDLAVANVGKEPQQLAAYLYQMMYNYRGPAHGDYCTEVMRQTFEALSRGDAKPGREVDWKRDSDMVFTAISTAAYDSYEEAEREATHDN